MRTHRLLDNFVVIRNFIGVDGLLKWPGERVSR